MSVSTATRRATVGTGAPPRWQVALVVLPIGVVAFVLGRILWPDTPGVATPPPSVLPIFVAISALESLLFGFGVAFVVFGRRWLPADGSKLATASFVAIAWTLLSWWPHDN